MTEKHSRGRVCPCDEEKRLRRVRGISPCAFTVF